jgi:hypothetical protein
MAVLGQKREHAPGRYQLPGQRLRVQQLPIRPRNPLHHSIITRHTGRSRQTRPALDELFSAVLDKPSDQSQPNVAAPAMLRHSDKPQSLRRNAGLTYTTSRDVAVTGRPVPVCYQRVAIGSSNRS